MGRRSLLTVAASFAALLVAPPSTAQSPAPDRLATARTALRAMKLDSAALLVRQALDSASSPSRDDRIEAWLLLGVVEFYQGKDSASASDFREALVLKPDIAASGLARYDSALVVSFAAQREAMVAGRAPSPTHGDSVLDCTRLCPANVVKPRFVRMPPPDWPPAVDAFEVRHSGGVFRVRFIIDTAGRVVPRSIRVVTSTLQLKEMQRVYLEALAGAEFKPARAGERAVTVLVESEIRFGRGVTPWMQLFGAH